MTGNRMLLLKPLHADPEWIVVSINDVSHLLDFP